jgi:hypothetical protein
MSPELQASALMIRVQRDTTAGPCWRATGPSDRDGELMRDEFDMPRWLVILRTTLDRLAAPADRQVEYLEKLRVGPLADELALEFDAAFAPLRPRMAESPDYSDLLAALKDLDRELLNKSNEWYTSSLADSERWAAIRQAAAWALRLMSDRGETGDRNSAERG